MSELPASIARRLETLTLTERRAAFLRIDETRVVVAAGGHLGAYGLAALCVGESVTTAAPFLEGLLPLDESPFLLPSVELGNGAVADLHFYEEGGAIWLILLDAAAERNATRRLQQKAYDMTLLQEREAALNRQLKATNEALLAAQRELEDSRTELLVAHTRVQAQAMELAALNATLEARVEAQVGELERLARLKRFFAPALAELIVASGDERILESHRRDIAALFCDLRGFTSFAETAEPEEVMELLREYHGALVPLIHEFEGTLDRFLGDGIMVFFNDPLPCPDPALRAVRLAVAMREAVARLAAAWRQRGWRLGFGIGAAQGFATLGRIGFEGRFDYSAIGTVINTAARLCEAAQDGQILVTSRIAAAVSDDVETSDVGPVTLRGISRPLAVFNVTGYRKMADEAIEMRVRG
jgi:class 3 adenylate cyclase